MATEKVRYLLNKIVSDDNVEAGEAFNDVMKEKQVDAIDLKRVEVQLDWMNSGNSPEEKPEEE